MKLKKIMLGLLFVCHYLFSCGNLLILFLLVVITGRGVIGVSLPIMAAIEAAVLGVDLLLLRWGEKKGWLTRAPIAISVAATLLILVPIPGFCVVAMISRMLHGNMDWAGAIYIILMMTFVALRLWLLWRANRAQWRELIGK